jgi:hypothetical protein
MRAYGDLALREFGDLDLLVRETDFERARALLRAQGYQPAYSFPPSLERAYLYSLRQLPFVRPDDNLLVELHTGLTPRAFGLPLESGELWQRRETDLLFRESVFGLASEDLLLALCAHGAKHLWGRLGWVCDLAELLHRRPNLDWVRLVRRARTVGGERLLWLGLELARRLLGTEIPSDFRRLTRKGISVPGLADGGCAHILSGSVSEPDGWVSLAFHLRSRERLRDGLRYGLSLALTPTAADWVGTEGRVSFSSLYYLFRPWRLMRKYAFGRHPGGTPT